MSLDSYLKEKAAQGALDSKGRFTLDLVRAAELFGSLTFEEPYYSFLSYVQSAHRLAADKLEFHVGLANIEARFESQESLDFERLLPQIVELDETSDPLFADLRSALLGGSRIGGGARLSCLSRGKELFLEVDREGKLSSGMGSSNESGPKEAGSRVWVLRVSLSSRWMFWKVRERAEKLKRILTEKCSFSAVDLWVNADSIERAGSSILNSHLREFHASQFNAALGVMQNLKSRVAPSNILFKMASHGLAVAPPEFDCYDLTEERCLWRQGLRKDNQFRPDSDDSPAWMLQFVDGAPDLKQKIVCSAVLAFNLHGPGVQEPLRIKVVRHGVTIHESKVSGEDVEVFRGCILVFADEDLPTDLSGLRLVESDELVTRLGDFAPLVALGQEYFERWGDSISWA